jgi:hypothetical protein
MGFNTLGTFYWAFLVGERNADSWVPCPSPHWDNRWSPGMIRKKAACGADLFLPTTLSSRASGVYDFSSFYSDTFPLILVFYAAFFWRIYLCFLLIGNGSILILSVMLLTNCINLSVKKFSFLTCSIDHWSKIKKVSPIKSNHRLKIFFLTKTIDLIDDFYS